MFKKIWQYFKNMAIAATPAGGGGASLNSEDRAKIDSIPALSTKVDEMDKSFTMVLPFKNTLTYTHIDSMAYKIDSVLGQGDQVVTLQGYTFGATITPGTPLIINVDKHGVATLIGELINE